MTAPALTALEKLALEEIRPAKLRGIPDAELQGAWAALVEELAELEEGGGAIENVVNAGLWVKSELERRGLKATGTGAEKLLRRIEEISKALDQGEIQRRLKRLPKEVVVVPDFVAMVGSAAEGKEEPNDLDILIRAKEAKDGYLIQAENVWLPIRNLFDPEKEGGLQFIPNAQGPHGDNVPMFDLVLRRKDNLRRRVVKADGLAPGVAFTPPKPAERGVTERFETDELWTWAEDRLPVAIEPKHNGFRAIAEKKGDDVRLWFEGSRDQNRLASLPDVVTEALNAVSLDYVLDLDIGIEKRGARLPRPELAKLNADMVALDQGERIVLTVFDLPFAGAEDLHDQPFRKRRDDLEEFFVGQLSGKGNDLLRLSPVRWVDSRRELEAAVRWGLRQDRSEGIIAKAETGRYELDGSTSSQAKLKRVAELKVVVLDVQRNADGTLSYTAGLMPSDAPAWENLTKLGDEEFVELGQTLSTKVQARPGDVLTVEVLELIPSSERLVWSGATVVDRDATLEAPFSTNQSIDIASRAKILQKAAEDFLPATMPTRAARVAFVTTDPSPLELARDEALVGDAGRVFVETYLDALGIEKAEVAVIPAIPIPVDGRPSVAEAVQWHGWVRKQLERTGGVVVALGRVARAAAGDLADFTLPHPAAVLKRGDNGEVARKARAIRKALSEPNTGRLAADARRASAVKQRGEGDTSSERASKFWLDNWHEMFPPSGKGKMVFHRHWRGLTEDETKLTDAKLLETENSLHGDLRFEGPRGRGLWGLTIFRSDDPKGTATRDLEIGKLPDDDAFQGQPKLAQPDEWLTIARRAPHLVKPGGVGSTSEAWAKFFEVANGRYEMGVWRESSLEFFIRGAGGLTGRYLFARTEEGDGDRRVWILRKPEDQTPIAEKEDLEKVLAELRRKRQKWLVWGKPGQRPQKINVRTGRVEKDIRIPIAKADQSKGIVYGVVLDPYQADLHGDWIPPADVEEAAHRFMERGQTVNLRHRAKLDAVVMESTLVQYPSEDDYRNAMAGEPHSIYEMPYGDQMVRSGTWILGVLVRDPKARAEVESGELDAFSIEGLGIRRPATRSEVPTVRIIQLKPAA